MSIEERILILAPLGEDAANAAQVLSQAGISGEICFDLFELRQKFLEGAGALLITEESFTSEEISPFLETLKQQEPWSDVPIIIITSGGETTELSLALTNLFDSFGNVNLLERPLRTITLISTVQVALRARRRQYQMKLLLDKRKESEQRIQYYAEELLKNNKSLQQFAAIVKHSEDAIISKDLNGIIVSWNNAAQRIFGYKPQEVIGKSISLLIPEDRFNEEPSFLARIRRGQKVEHYDTVRRRKDGSLVDISLTISPIRDEKGVIIGASKIARDITQRKKVEQDLMNMTIHLEKRVEERTRLLEEQTDRLRQLAVELTEAEQRERRRLAEVLHDHLQQYLVAAKMRLHLAERKFSGFVEGLQEAGSYIDNAIDASRQLTAELRPPVLYEGGLSAALHFLSQKMEKQHKFRVHLSLGKDIEPSTDSVKVMIYQCVQELLFNAVKYAKSMEAFVTVIRRENQSLQILVEDTGVGFDVTTVGKKRDKGGFGLFSIRERIRAISGEFKIESNPGEGALFTLIVPDNVPAAEPEEIKSDEIRLSQPASPKGAGIVVLVADDHPIIRQSIASLLSSQQFIREVIQADNGEDAVRKAQSSHPDIILMDINMPVMNGIEATQMISNMNSRMKVIGLSVQPGSEMGEAMKQAGAVDYFNKGDDANTLIDSIKKFAYDSDSELLAS